MVTVDDVRRAHARIRDAILLSPCARSETFSQLSGNQVFLKLENHQMTGAYKERGALNKLLLLSEAEKKRKRSWIPLGQGQLRRQRGSLWLFRSQRWQPTEPIFPSCT